MRRSVQEDTASKISCSEENSDDARSESAAKKMKFNANSEESSEVQDDDSDHESGPSVSGVTGLPLSKDQR